MAKPEHLQILRQGLKAWNQWRSENIDITPNLAMAALGGLRKAALREFNLHGANLYGANLRKAALAGADLSGATNLYGANLTRANLQETNLRRVFLEGAALNGAALTRADLRDANLRKADLTEANLHEANLVGANLVGANLSWVILYGTVFGDTSLTTVQGLETCHHHAPSTLDHRTLAKSGLLPLAFLRGCGLPEALIEYLPSLMGETVQFYTCFISYSSADEDFCRRLHGRLQDAGLRVWFAPHDIQGGQKLHEQIDQAIRVYDKLLLVLSPHSMQSPWVEFEIRRARRREVAEQRRLLFPVRLVDYEAIKAWECFDADTAKDLATEIREYYIPDFTAWKDHDAFEAAVGRLLRDLKAAERQP
jgi:TIR domain/Pentapeptide repeats (8 copies)